MKFESPKGFTPAVVAFQRRWRRSYLLTVRWDPADQSWRYILSRASLFVVNGAGFSNADAAADAAMIRARMDHAARGHK